jgi:hypothetical protein
MTTGAIGTVGSMEIEFSAKPFHLTIRTAERRKRAIMVGREPFDVALYRAAVRRTVSELVRENAELRRSPIRAPSRRAVWLALVLKRALAGNRWL